MYVQNTEVYDVERLEKTWKLEAWYAAGVKDVQRKLRSTTSWQTAERMSTGC